MKAGLWGGMQLTEYECKARPGRGMGCLGPECRLMAWGTIARAAGEDRGGGGMGHATPLQLSHRRDKSTRSESTQRCDCQRSQEGAGWKEGLKEREVGRERPRGAPISPLFSLAAWKGDGKKTGKEKLWCPNNTSSLSQPPILAPGRAEGWIFV